MTADIDEGLELDDYNISGKLDVNWLLSRALDRLHAQLLKLPHEVASPQLNEMMGVKYDDIKQSYVDGINGLCAMIEPIENLKEATDFKDAFKVLRKIVKAMQKNRIMYQKEKQPVIDEKPNGEIYESKQDPLDLEQPAPEDDLETPVP